jgi:hypothetical protein
LNTEDLSRHKTSQEEKEKQISDSVNGTFFTNRLNTFSSMYKINVNANDFVFAIREAWTLMKSGDAQKKADGQKVMGGLFKNVLKSSFEVERNASYNEHRIPEFNEIIKSTNELFRSAMYAFTDLYHDPGSASLFGATAFGGLDAKAMAEAIRDLSKDEETQRKYGEQARKLYEACYRYDQMIDNCMKLYERINKK